MRFVFCRFSVDRTVYLVGFTLFPVRKNIEKPLQVVISIMKPSGEDVQSTSYKTVFTEQDSEVRFKKLVPILPGNVYYLQISRMNVGFRSFLH